MTRVLVVAKAPVPGRAKTRLAATLGDAAAADLAAACLLDTLDVARSFAGPSGVIVALTGDLRDAGRGGEVEEALAGLNVVPQRGSDFAERLVNAHTDAGDGPVLQIGMDTPQVTPELLAASAEALTRYGAVLGAATDGGWWVLGRHLGSDAEILGGVPMSSPTTYDETRAALVRRGLRVAEAPRLRDLDEVTDGAAVASAAPGTRFAAAWAALGRPARSA